MRSVGALMFIAWVEGLPSCGTQSAGLRRLDAPRRATDVGDDGRSGRGLGLCSGGCESRVCDMYGVCYVILCVLRERVFTVIQA